MKTLHPLRGHWLAALLFTTMLAAPPFVAAEKAPGVGELFLTAYDKKDEAAMKKLIKERTDEFPPEVMGMVQYAVGPNVSPEEQDAYFNLAGTIAKMYGEHTKDNRLLNAVRMNYQQVMEKRQAALLPPAAVEKAKKELMALGNKAWRISVFELEDDGALTIEIDVRDTSNSSFTPRIDMKTSARAKAIVENNLTNIQTGSIAWSSMGVGLKTVLLGE